MPQGSTPTPLLVLLLATLGYAMAGLHLWPSVHVALSNSSVFLNYDTAERNASSDIRNMTLTLVDTETNATLLTRTLPANQSEGRLEFNCSCFLYAGTFHFRLEQIDYATANSNANASLTDRDGNGVVTTTTTTTTTTATWWWSSELQVEWPTFHIAVDRASNQSGSFQVGISTNELFQSCSSGLGSALFLEVSYLEFNQIGRNSIDKVRARTRHPIKELHSQTVDLLCAFHFTERDFIRVALRSPHTNQDVKSSGPLYLSRIFSYKLLVDNINSYRSGCEGAVSLRLVTPPCALINGKVLLFRDGDVGSEGKGGTGAGGGVMGAEGLPPSVPLAFNWLTQGENETEFNCSVFDPGRNKYCFRFVLNFSRSQSPAQTCLVVNRNTESWGVWQAWSVCSVSCGEGVRERVRECLLPSGGGSMQCTGMVKEQSLCSLEDCAASSSFLGGNLVVVAGISLCLAVILATILVTLWRKLCRTPQCSSVRRGSMHSPGGRKLSDEASICGNSLQRPSLSDSQGNHGGTGPGLAQNERPNLGCKPLPQPPPLVIPLVQDPDRLSPSGQKVLPPIFGYRLAQQQLKEMKKRGLREATQLYHVSQSPVHDTLLEESPTATATPTQPGFTLPGLSPNSSPLNLQEDDSNLSRFRITAPFPEPRVPQRSSVTLPDRLSPRVELVLGPPVAGYMREGGGGSSERRDRTADWVEMVERTGLGGMGGGGVPSNSYQKNPNCRRTSSFHDTKPPPPPAAPCRPHRERSQTQVGPRTRTLPEGSCRTRGTLGNQTQNPAYPPYPIPEQSTPDWARPKPRPPWPGDDRRRPWVETGCPPCFSNKPKHAENNNTYLISDPKHTETNTTTAAMLGSELLSNTELTLERERRRTGDRREGGEERGERGGTSGIGGPGLGPGVGSRGCPAYLTPDRAERAEHNWNRRGPSPIQRNILARKLREAQSCNTASDQQGRHNQQQQRQRSSTFSVSVSEQRKGRCRSLPLSGDSTYGLTEAEQCMLDLDMTSLYLGEDEF
eukprot:XP_013985347.1 PREDICTED: thrombospondin type-1 domain-containing protein 1 isoform X2 [Salmo salar]